MHKLFADLSSGCHRKILSTGWREKQKLTFTFLEAGSQRTEYWYGGALVRTVLGLLSHGREGKKSTPISFLIRPLIPSWLYLNLNPKDPFSITVWHEFNVGILREHYTVCSKWYYSFIHSTHFYLVPTKQELFYA